MTEITQPLNDFFNLPPETEPVVDDEPIITAEKVKVPKIKREELLTEAKSVYSSLSTAEKVDFALPTVTGLEQHDTEMDNIRHRAIKSFEDMMSLGGNVSDMYAGKIYEVGSQMLKTAMDAMNSKTDKKLRLIELQLKKLKAEQAETAQSPSETKSSNTEFDRNELLSHIVTYSSTFTPDK